MRHGGFRLFQGERAEVDGHSVESSLAHSVEFFGHRCLGCGQAVHRPQGLIHQQPISHASSRRSKCRRRDNQPPSAAREGAQRRELEPQIGHRRGRGTSRRKDGVVQLPQPVERNPGEGMVGRVILHLPAKPAHDGVGAGAPRVGQYIVFVRQTQMFDRVLQLVNALHRQHRRQPENHRRPAARPPAIGGRSAHSRPDASAPRGSARHDVWPAGKAR